MSKFAVNDICVHIGDVIRSGARHEPAMRSYVLGCLKGRFLDAMDDGREFEKLVLFSVTSMAHPVGTCALGDVVGSDTALR